MKPLERAVSEVQREVTSVATSLELRTEWLKDVAKTATGNRERLIAHEGRIASLEKSRAGSRSFAREIVLIIVSTLAGFLAGLTAYYFKLGGS